MRPNMWEIEPISEEEKIRINSDRDFSHFLDINPKTKIFKVDYYENWEQEMKTIKIKREELNTKLNEMWHRGCALWWVR